MSLMQWVEDKYGTTVDVFDCEHKELFDRVNALNNAVTKGDRIDIGNHLDSLVFFVVKHFETEERLMRERGYNGFERHRQDHDHLVRTCTDLQDRFHAGEIDIDEETMTYIRDWLDHHIPVIDKSYGPALSD